MRAHGSRKRILSPRRFGSHLTDRLLGPAEVLCVDTCSPARSAISIISYTICAFEFMLRRSLPAHVEVDRSTIPPAPPRQIHYQHDPVQTTKTSVHGAINMLTSREAVRCKIFQASTMRFTSIPSFIRKPRAYWGNVNLRPFATTRGAARKPCFRLSPAARARDQGRQDLQHLRPLHAIPADGRVVSNFIMVALF